MRYQHFEYPYVEVFSFDKPFKIIPCLQKSHHPFCDNEICSLFMKYLDIMFKDFDIVGEPYVLVERHET
jgi:hypothetical protein